LVAFPTFRKKCIVEVSLAIGLTVLLAEGRALREATLAHATGEMVRMPLENAN
jgi:invasion protein IalB